MANLSDPDVLPDLIDQTWALYQQPHTDAQGATLAGQLQDLTQQLADLSDVTLDKTKQEYGCGDCSTERNTANQTGTAGHSQGRSGDRPSCGRDSGAGEGSGDSGIDRNRRSRTRAIVIGHENGTIRT